MTKKIIIIFVTIIIVSGCTLNNNSAVRSTIINGQDKLSEVNFKEGEILAKINQLNNRNMQTNQQASQPKDSNVTRDMGLENLSATYDQALMRTSLGNIKLQFYANESPLTVNNFLNLVKKGFYNGTTFHRVIKDFMIQGGDPNSKDDDWSNDGMGGPGYSFADEFNSHPLVRGSLAMANSGPNTNGSQFFIVTAEATPWLDGKHTNFGEVVEGMDVVKLIESAQTNENDHPLKDIVVEDISLLSSADDYKLDPAAQAEIEELNKQSDEVNSINNRDNDVLQ